MKKIYLVIVSALLVGCGGSVSSKKNNINIKNKTIVKQVENVKVKKPVKKASFLKMTKTVCSGDCPVYNITISEKGKVVFNGEQNTIIKGRKEFQLTSKEFSELKKQINTDKFKTYKSKYDNPELLGLPSTFVSHNGKKVEVRLWKEAPQDLIMLHEFLEGILLKQKLIN